MSENMFHVIVPIIIVIFLFWLLYRIKRKVTNIIRNKIIDEFPLIKNELDSLQEKIDYLNTRMDSLEQKINAKCKNNG